MTLRPFVFVLLWSPALLLFDAHFFDAPSDDDFLRVASMLDRGWKPSAKSLDAAREEYEAIQADGRANPRVTYAFALVQMRNRRYDEAKRLLDEVLAVEKNNGKNDLSAQRRASGYSCF